MKAEALKVRWFGRKMWGRRSPSSLGCVVVERWRCDREEGPDVIYHFNGLSVIDPRHNRGDEG